MLGEGISILQLFIIIACSSKLMVVLLRFSITKVHPVFTTFFETLAPHPLDHVLMHVIIVIILLEGGFSFAVIAPNSHEHWLTLIVTCLLAFSVWLRLPELLAIVTFYSFKHSGRF